MTQPNMGNPMEVQNTTISPEAQAAVMGNAIDLPVSVPKKKTATPVINDGATTLSINVEVDQNENQKKYFVRLPHSQYEFNVRGLLVEEEDRIKSSNTSTKKAAETIMKTLYDCISNDIKTKDHPFSRFDTFCQSISLADRDAITVAIIEQTYESSHDMNIRCGRCGKSFDERINLPECMTYKFYDGSQPILQKRHVLDFPDIGWKMYLKIPTLWDELKTLNLNEKATDIQHATDYIFIDKLEYDDTTDRGDKIHETITNYVQIYSLLKKKPAILRKRIEKEYEKFRGKYCFSL